MAFTRARGHSVQRSPAHRPLIWFIVLCMSLSAQPAGEALHKCHCLKKNNKIYRVISRLWTICTLNCPITGFHTFSSSFMYHTTAVLPVSTNVLNFRYLPAARADKGCSTVQVSTSNTTAAVLYVDSKVYSVLFCSVLFFSIYKIHFNLVFREYSVSINKHLSDTPTQVPTWCHDFSSQNKDPPCPLFVIRTVLKMPKKPFRIFIVCVGNLQ